jgi:RimJ/RimL family protein N-acetyltransferase
MNEPAIGIRRFRSEDVPLLFAAVRESVPEVAPWMPWCHPDYSMEESAAWVQSREEAWTGHIAFDFVIFEPDTGSFLGSVGLNQLNAGNRFANLGYWVRTSATKRGIATAAVRMGAGFGFERLGLQRIEIVVAAGNTASLRVAEKAGAVREGLLRNRLRLRDRAVDAFMHSLVPTDLGL